uniref:Uncharacterized protein n=1 Tax=Anguilla anguilla TaxID=7936 RepID=A0A0E9PK75_ANGAN
MLICWLIQGNFHKNLKKF